MKKLLILAAALLLLPLAANATEFKEGVNYKIISDKPASVKPNLTEYFSFYCPHCYHFSKTFLPKLKADMPKDMTFKQIHVEFIGREMGVVMSRAWAISELLNVSDKIEPALFAAIHEKHQRFTSMEDVKQFFVAEGVDAKEFEAAANSFMVNSMVASMKRSTENAKIEGVPALVVNEKYLIDTASLKSFEQLAEIIKYLSKLE
ncbi:MULTISPECIES: thiol:disulfide interchange protein DsbA/DsbL [Shewanella]|jgi:thiol:disulfide interchange protein DsbA|uniref:Thiol:disulfide interchange protein n=1 Tax=Shewanella fodinae TaxID=552357 RepID=A0A4V2RRQ4_9GAMM|nr:MULTISPECIES: thiol:disulfide interchange protein DsbA/DsbL [Shewanella]MBO1271000.1 thiol:disulfide interchange protein DsbA/DsbL [Shewanella sp. 4t3-1-2LB]MCL2908321.1 thiol:disulfide interchange protein DsbA/DsbL [Shewanella fodinae]TCN80742.1 thiol:disulfide interchange protein DsbA [Shewanella fodinae]GGZ15433.1 thiol:disulfide interchange protein [Shewanella fodinae]